MSATKYDNAYAQLKDWLNALKPDYNQGLALLLSYCDKPALHEQFTMHRSPAKLYDVLLQLFKEVKEKHQQAARQLPAPAVNAVPVVTPAKRPTSGPPITAELDREWVELIKQIEDRKQNLFYLGRDASTGEKQKALTTEQKEQRRLIAKMLVGPGGLNEQCLRNRDAKGYFQTFGVLPERSLKAPAAARQASNSGDVYLLKENCRKRVAKLKSKIKAANENIATASDAKRIHLSTMIFKWEAELAKEQANLNAYKSKSDGEQGN
jgi:hypothetical protein